MGELVPGILPQLGHENLQMLRKLAEAYESASKGKGPAAAGADDDVPDLVENFDEAANGQVE
jgi:nascent polypeptide-associated complex subunit beta